VAVPGFLRAVWNEDVSMPGEWSCDEIVALARRNADAAFGRLSRWLNLDPDADGIEWLPQQWSRWVPIEWLTSRLCQPGPDGRWRIYRRDLFRLAADGVTSEPDEQATVALLLGVVVWGAGCSDTRGPWKAAQALAMGESLEPGRQAMARIRHAVQVTRNEGAWAGYAALSVRGPAHLRQMGESYFTKLSYAVGYGCHATPQPWPLILDNNVRKALVRSGGILHHEHWSLDRSPIAYRQYLCIAHTWAQMWNVPADHVEYALFRLGRDGG
jgi:hypothetical protein